MRPKHWLFLILTCTPWTVFSQTTPISLPGYVKDVRDKGVPGTVITAAGLERAPARTDSTGFFLIDVTAAPGGPITFHVEHPGYVVIIRTLPASTMIPTVFALTSSTKPTNKQVLRSIGSGLKPIDVMYDQLDCPVLPCPQRNRQFVVQLTEQVGINDHLDQLVFTHDSGAASGASILGHISETDLNQLDSETKVMVMALGDAVVSSFSQWTALYPQISNPSLPAEEKRRVANQLSTVGIEMCGNLKNLVDVLQGVNLTIWDHYGKIVLVCDAFKQAHITY
jgi:hypothetical protein